MRTGCVFAKSIVGSVAFALFGVVGAQTHRSPAAPLPLAAAASLYELSDPLPLSPTRWEPLFDTRLDLSTGLLPRHEVRLTSGSRSGWTGFDAGLAGYDMGWSLDPLRATYRYTVLERRDWAWKVGITTRLGETDASRGPAFDRTRFGTLPQVHMAGEARFAANWLLSVNADGLMTPRGRALDLGVRLDYALGRTFHLYGRYRLSDRYADGEESAMGLTNSANVGVRYRF